jgi:hypothetical protein
VAAYSKTKVDRAGQILADRLRSVVDGTAIVGEPPSEVIDAVGVIEWWRGEHARPLSRVAANLRYYVSEHGEPAVTQRLKKFPTIADKLLRQPKMKLRAWRISEAFELSCPTNMLFTASLAGCGRIGRLPKFVTTSPSRNPMAIGPYI